MVIVLNGPLGVGKSTLAEVLAESINGCVSLDGDHVVAANPPARDDQEHLHSTIALLFRHHRGFGYRHFVINHLWTDARELDDLRHRLRAIDGDTEIHVYLLTLPEPENLRRIEVRAAARAIDELAAERILVKEERRALQRATGLGEPFDASAPPGELARRLLSSIGYGSRLP
jgi:hypothetical protein